MKIRFHRNFEKQFARLNEKIKKQTKERIKIFFENPYHPLLNNHPLKGKYLDYRSINISGDFRLIYKQLSENEHIIIAIGKHSDLYE